MDINKILDGLRQELQQVESAIASMESLAANTGKRRGRPPAWLTKAKEQHGQSSSAIEISGVGREEPPDSA